jgi:glycosyltransferase involved in cell wall biosynthesis
VAAGRPVIALAANSGWNIVNFRVDLIHALKGAGYEPVVIAPEEPAIEARMAGLGVERIALKIDRSGVNPAADLRLLRDYRRVLRQLRPAAFLGFTIKPNIYGSMAATALGIPAVPNVSGLGTAFIRPGPLQWLVTRLYRRAFRDVALVLFQNSDDRQLFVTRRIVEHERTRLVPGSGVDLERFAPAAQPEGPLTFLLVGRLLRDKGVIEFVEAAHGLRGELPDARFQLLGPIDEGNRTTISRSEVDRWVRDGVVDYLGTTDDVRPHIAAASAVVLPSYREGMPRSLLEAGAMARPLIATHVPGCREVVEDGVNGFLCNPAEPMSLASAMKKFAELPRESRHAMGEASRRKVQDRFSEQIVVRTYLDVLKRLLGSQP